MSTYNFYEMKKKPSLFATDYIAGTYDSMYASWEEYISDKPYVGNYNTNYWPKLQERFGEKVQLTILLAVTIPGIAVANWKDVFADIFNETGAFTNFSQELSTYNTINKLDWWSTYVHKVAKNGRLTNHYPCVAPRWLYPYSYYLNQSKYISILEKLWDNVHSAYHIPWEGTTLGPDSPEIARIRMVGKEARREIDATAQYASKRHQGR